MRFGDRVNRAYARAVATGKPALFRAPDGWYAVSDREGWVLVEIEHDGGLVLPPGFGTPRYSLA